MFSQNTYENANTKNNNATVNPWMRGPSPEEREMERRAVSQRQRERKRRMSEVMANLQPDATAELVDERELQELAEEHPTLRGLAWGRSSRNGNAIHYADPGDDYDMWQQAYRMLGGFIDCDNAKGEGSHDNGNNNGGDGQQACSRWMMWAAVSNYL